MLISYFNRSVTVSASHKNSLGEGPITMTSWEILMENFWKFSPVLSGYFRKFAYILTRSFLKAFPVYLVVHIQSLYMSEIIQLLVKWLTNVSNKWTDKHHDKGMLWYLLQLHLASWMWPRIFQFEHDILSETCTAAWLKWYLLQWIRIPIACSVQALCACSHW